LDIESTAVSVPSGIAEQSILTILLSTGKEGRLFPRHPVVIPTEIYLLSFYITFGLMKNFVIAMNKDGSFQLILPVCQK
jgi:hypothetical protein